MRVLGIETSCDETGVALFDSEQGLLGHQLYSQIKLHEDYGGVVPELASRDHVRKLLPLIDALLADCKLPKTAIDAVAFTNGPGLVGALMVGACTGRALAFSLGVPAIGVHHMEGHLLAPMLEANPPEFPLIALLVSGGHTQLVRVDAIGEYTMLGESLDDAAGEAFDKAAKMLDLDYPGGPHIARYAEKGVAGRFTFPRPMVDRPGLDFSFSGLKTYTLNTVAEHAQANGLPDEQTCADIAHAFQEAVVDTLVIKCRRALQQENLKTLVIAGGVSANTRLREKLETALKKIGAGVFYARHEFCTDNGAMIAYAGCQRLLAGQKNELGVKVQARWPLDSLSSIESDLIEKEKERKLDRVIIEQLRLETIIGLFPWERKVRQQLLVDIEIGTDIRPAAATDDLHNTIDYAEVCDHVAALADDGKFKLIETFAEKIAQLVLSDFSAQWVKVMVKKTDALPQVSSVGVVIERSADTL